MFLSKTVNGTIFVSLGRVLPDDTDFSKMAKQSSWVLTFKRATRSEQEGHKYLVKTRTSLLETLMPKKLL